MLTTARKPDPEYIQSETGWHQVVMWHGVAMLPALRGMADETLDALLQEANQANLAEPLQFCRNPQFVLPTNGNQKLTGGEVAAICVFGLWVKQGERASRAVDLKGTPDESLAGSLVQDWPEIPVALALCPE